TPPRRGARPRAGRRPRRSRARPARRRPGWRGFSPSCSLLQRSCPGTRQLVFRRVAPACRALALPLASARFAPGSTHREANVRGSSAFLRLPTYEHRLPNGLTVLIREDHSAPVVAIVTHVRAGYFNEPDRLVGISHVLEHMYF